jgi:serine/threonine protein kinase
MQWDLRPANVVLAKDGRVLLRCANLMAALRSAWRGAGSARAFLAPETLAIDNAAIDSRADIYGCGALLFSQLALKPPPADPSAVRAALGGLPTEIVELTTRCLAADPKARPASFPAVAEALAPFAGKGAAGAGDLRRWILAGAVAAGLAAAYYLFA